MKAPSKAAAVAGACAAAALIVYGAALANASWASRDPLGGAARWAAAKSFGSGQPSGPGGALAKWAMKAGSSNPQGFAAKAAMAALSSLALAGDDSAITAVCIAPIVLRSAPESVKAAREGCGELAARIPAARSRVEALGSWRFSLAAFLESLA